MCVWGVCVCVCVLLCIYVYVSFCVCVCVTVFVCAYVSVYTCVCTCVHASISVNYIFTVHRGTSKTDYLHISYGLFSEFKLVRRDCLFYVYLNI